MSGLIVPSTPSNLRGVGNTPIDSDVFHIAERIKEIDPNLNIWPYEKPVYLGDKVYNYAITEQCKDGVERLVFRTAELDARIITHLQYLLKVPFAERFAKAEALEAKDQAAFKEAEHEDLYNRVGAPMRRQLEHDGFIAHRGVSYPKRGVKPHNHQP